MKKKTSITVAMVLAIILTLSVFSACNQKTTMKEPSTPPTQSPEPDYHRAGTAAKGQASKPDYTRAGTAAKMAQPPTATESPR